MVKKMSEDEPVPFWEPLKATREWILAKTKGYKFFKDGNVKSDWSVKNE